MLCNRFDITNQTPRSIQDHCEEHDLLKSGYLEPDLKDTTCNKPGFEFPLSESIWHKSLATVWGFGLLIPFFFTKIVLPKLAYSVCIYIHRYSVLMYYKKPQQQQCPPCPCKKVPKNSLEKKGFHSVLVLLYLPVAGVWVQFVVCCTSCHAWA